MSKFRRLKGKGQIILWIAVAAGVMMLLIPQVGPWVLLDEIMGLIMMICFMIEGILILVTGKDRRKDIKGLLCAVALIAVFGWCAISGLKEVAMDIAAGKEYVVLDDCQMEKRRSYKGVAGMHYYLTGRDESGEKYRLKINGKAYEELKGKRMVGVTCYKNTGRIVSY